MRRTGLTGRTRAARTLIAATLAAAPLLAAGPAVAAPLSTPPVPDTSVQYWFGNYQISKIWALGATGQGITVAVLDSGVQADRVEFTGGVVLRGTDFAGGDGRTDTDRPVGHGTSIARFIAGQGGGRQDLTGIAPGAKILPITVHSETLSAEQSISMGIDYAATHGAKVINLSVASDGTGLPDHCPTTVATAVRTALARGAVVVAGAGNDGAGANPPEWPAACPGVIAVGAIDGAKKPWPKSERQSYVDVAAPGVGMADTTLTNVVGTSDGTSNATALVSGAVALVWSKYPHLTNRQVVARLLATVTDDAATPGRDDATGYGIVRPYNAIVDRVPPTAPNPIFDEVRTSSGSGSPGPPASGSASAPASSSSSVAAPTASGDSGSSVGPLVIAALAVAVVVVLGIVLAVVLSRRRRPVPPGPPGYQPPGYYPPR
ncbi:MAG TPA: S8 family serine peptidase [Jatrophihabitans sp.]|uniref:S8 family serine peptidase n=1 Tax=Jatrophihabitans sp. TaxID=1932789 RepID=UPI002E08F696|nr:S8 family serine peptidase [Jatrophihabitans sp.]